MKTNATDLHTLRSELRTGRLLARDCLEAAIDQAQAPVCTHAFLGTSFEAARQQCDAADASQPLAGLPFSVKDSFDVQGQPTPAGSTVLKHAPAAKNNSPAVARLLAAGGALIGRTNMTEFAFSGVGVNPHYGTPHNVADNVHPRIPGGSSSGAAVSVAAGAAFIGLGSDTGGSIRIPAALNGIVGFKSTARLVPTYGALPLSQTLDTVCAMTRSVRDAVLAHEILSDRRVNLQGPALAGMRFAVPNALFLDGMDSAVAQAFENALRLLREAGAIIDTLNLPPLSDLPAINSTGGLSAAESYAWHRTLLESSAAAYDPRVSQRIAKGAAMKAWEYLDLLHARITWIERMLNLLAPYDAILSPTVPIVAPLLACVAPGPAQDDEFFRLNALLLRNPSVVNMLDGCAISIPCHAPGELPVGLMIWHGALHDDSVLRIATQVEEILAQS